MIPIIKPLLGEAEKAAVSRVLDSGWVTQGPEVAAFEEAFSGFTGASHAIAVSSCTAALHLALLAAGVQPGDEVITVSHSFIATANSIRYCGADPVFVDVRADTFNIDPGKVEAAITPRTRALLCVHQMGMPCDMDSLRSMAGHYRLALVEDAACAIGSEIRIGGEWQRIGRPHGDLACFSFHPRKILTTGDGGMITTADPETGQRLKSLRQHAMSVPDTVRHKTREVLFESYGELGFNYRLTDIQAAVGRVQLQRLPAIVARRRELAANYHTLIDDRIPDLIRPREPEWARSNWQSYCVRLPARLDQKRVMQQLLDDGFATRRGIMCAHREPAYAGGERKWRLPVSEACQDHGLLLPLYHDMETTDQERLIASLEQICR